MNKTALAIVIMLTLAACGAKPAENTAVDTSDPEASKADEVIADVVPQAFNKELNYQDVHFLVNASNSGSKNSLTITPSGLSDVNDIITREIDGTVTNAEAADINADGSPEIYVWVNSVGSGGYASPIGYSANKKKSLSEIYFPPISDDPVNRKGYAGHDEFAVVEGAIAQRFPLYGENDTNAAPTGKTRQLQYKLTQGEASWVMKLDRVTEF